MKNLLLLASAVVALAGASPALADSIDFAQFGSGGATVASPSNGTTRDGVNFSITSPNNQFQELVEGQSWNGEFYNGETILFDGEGPGPVTIDFLSPVASILHLNAQANAYGAYIATLTAFDGLTNLGSVSVNGFNDLVSEGTVPYLDFTSSVITSIQISTTNDSAGFALGGTGGTNNAPPVSGAPEPASWAMMLGGLALFGMVLRRRRQGQDHGALLAA